MTLGKHGFGGLDGVACCFVGEVDAVHVCRGIQHGFARKHDGGWSGVQGFEALEPWGGVHAARVAVRLHTVKTVLILIWRVGPRLDFFAFSVAARSTDLVYL